jgi:hypothetical protein
VASLDRGLHRWAVWRHRAAPAARERAPRPDARRPDEARFSETRVRPGGAVELGAKRASATPVRGLLPWTTRRERTVAVLLLDVAVGKTRLRKVAARPKRWASERLGPTSSERTDIAWRMSWPSLEPTPRSDSASSSGLFPTASDGSRSEAKADRAAADSWELSNSEVLIAPIRSSQIPALLAMRGYDGLSTFCGSERLSGRPDDRPAGRPEQSHVSARGRVIALRRLRPPSRSSTESPATAELSVSRAW